MSDSDASEATTKERARDEGGNILKADHIPSAKEVICPLVYRLTGGATRFDLAFQSTMSLGDNKPGCWRSAPQITLKEEVQEALQKGDITWMDVTENDIKQDSKGMKSARSYAIQFYQTLYQLKNAGKITWEQNAFFFTHEAGVKARESYQHDVLTGKTKANRRSWIGDVNDPEKPGIGFFAGVTWDQLTLGEVPDAARGMTQFDWYEGEQMSLGDYLRKFYTKTTTAYVSKKKQREKIANVVTGMGIQIEDIPEFLSEIAEQAGMPVDEVKELLLGKVDETQEVIKAPEADISEVKEPSAEDLAAIEQSEDESLVSGAETLEAAATDLNEEDEGDDHSFIRVHTDATRERIDVETEAISYRGTDHEEHICHLIELPESGQEMWLEPGKFYEIRCWDPGEKKLPEFERVLVVETSNS